MWWRESWRDRCAITLLIRFDRVLSLLPSCVCFCVFSKKSLFKTAQGEYISPDRIESVYSRSPLIAQAFVHGDSLESSLVAVVVPDEEELRAWASKHKIGSRDFADLVANPAVKAAIEADMRKFEKEAGLKGFETAQKVSDTPRAHAQAECEHSRDTALWHTLTLS